jgi:mannose-6-phosphate isomerase-like protein (cupin superfamily)
MPRYAVKRLEEVPRIATEAGDPDWYPIQHYFRFTAFGVNVYVAKTDGEELLAAHDELSSNQEELYFVTAGEATFTLDGEQYDVPVGSLVAAPDPAVERGASAKTAGTTVIAIGGEARPEFRSSWNPRWFEDAPQI